MKNNRKGVFTLILILVFIGGLVTVCFVKFKDSFFNGEKIEVENNNKYMSYRLTGNSLENFDLYFLQLENTNKNKVYSPLSIKYALAMLQEGAIGESKEQITNIIGTYNSKKYTNSNNMSFANAFFIKDTYKDSINDNYINTLKNKYNAEVKTDSFANPNKVNSWVNNKTLGLINNLFNDISQEDFLLINALAIDMEWEQKFMRVPGYGVGLSYHHEDFNWRGDSDIEEHSFKNMGENVSGMEIIASFNNYDIVKTLGEENIRKTVKSEMERYFQENDFVSITDYFYEEDKIAGKSENELMEMYLDRYVEEIDSNYKTGGQTTDFSFYVDSNVKAFAKDLKTYNGTTLQYVAIMPTNENLDSYVSKSNANSINKIIGNLKELKADNFKEGVVTKITGFIPKFKFSYELDLKNDLQKLGIKNVFELGKANLTNLSSDTNLFIGEVKHNANIELTQEGIKAAAVTTVGGFGGGGYFEYEFEVPVEEIDLTFDRPYMFIIRDINTGEVWFTGTVYEPLLYSMDTTKNEPAFAE